MSLGQYSLHRVLGKKVVSQFDLERAISKIRRAGSAHGALDEKVAFSAEDHAAADAYVVVRVHLEPGWASDLSSHRDRHVGRRPQTWLARSPIGPAAEPDPGSSTTPAAEANTRACSVDSLT